MKRLPLALFAVLLAGPARAQAPSLTLEPPDTAPNLFGGALSPVPDTDGDGVYDLLVGAPGGLTVVGQAFLFAGATGALLHTVHPPGLFVGGFFGAAVSGVPDVDGDGRGDLLIGALNEDDGPAGAGRAYLFSGATGDLIHTLNTPNPFAFGSFGQAVAGIPDVDDDDVSDLLIGAPGENTGGAAISEGRAYVFSGADGDLIHTMPPPVVDADLVFGYAVSGVPDVDGDDVGDLLVGAIHQDVGGMDEAGQAHLFSGATGERLRSLESPNPEEDGRFGWSVEGVEDLDGDGRGDLVVGAWNEDAPSPFDNDGRVHVFSGADGRLLHTLISPDPQGDGTALFGESVAGVPDIDDDGVMDVLVGAPHENAGSSSMERNAGQAHLFSGATGALLGTLQSPNPDGTNASVFGNFGEAVAGVPDLNGDGRGDLLVGAPREPGLDGRAYLFSGIGPTAAEPDAGSATLALSVHPNPAAGVTTLSFALARPGPVRLSLLDLLGREVAVVAEGERAAGPHAAAIDGRGLAGGVYVARLEAGGHVATRRLTLVR